MRIIRLWPGLAAAAVPSAGPAAAAEVGIPWEWQIDLQPAATPLMEMMRDFNFLISIIIVAITVFVLALLAYAMWRFRASVNPRPSRTSHNTVLEIAWTAIPVLILVVIAIPSFRLLYYEDHAVDAEMTIKAIGNTWYWTYEYPDHGNFTFDSFMLADDQLGPDQPRLLAVDNNVVVPVDTTIRVLTTSRDVIHAWAVPAAGVKRDAIPGRTNETWMHFTEEGIYYGQCSELCGVNHAFMPIAVEVVSEERFEQWVQEAQEQFARVEQPAAVDVARAAGE